MNLTSLTAFILDIDGVLYRGDQPLPGAAEFIAFLQQRQLPFLILTNNSTRTAARVAQRLQQMGMNVGAEHILTSSMAAALYLKKIRPQGARVYVVGEDGLSQPLADAGFTIADDGPADFVVLGMDRTVTYDKLRRATLLIRAGAQFIATNPDTTFPSPDGLVPGAGALIAALTASTSVNPLIIGKPEPTGFRLALEKLGADKATTAAIGDRLDTDILGAQRAGLHTILVLTGVSTRDDLARSTQQPDWVFDNLNELRVVLT
ncbi:MAG: HAD-IIA family hydrolase [Chloroflexota bacterium]